MSKIQDYYDFIDKFQGNLNESQKAVLAELEDQLIRKDVLPALRDNIEPSLRQLRRELILVVEYHPDEPISVRISRKRNLSDISEATLLTPDVVPGIKKRSPQQRKGNRKPNTNLRVTTMDGKVFYDAKDATNTFCDVLVHIGLLRVRQLEIFLSGLNLVSTSKDMNRTQRKIGNFYVFTNRSTADKAKKLKEISDRLNLGLKIEVI